MAPKLREDVTESGLIVVHESLSVEERAARRARNRIRAARRRARLSGASRGKSVWVAQAKKARRK